MPDGGLISESMTCSVSDDGKAKANATATIDAKNVARIYIRTIGFIAVLASEFFCAIAFMTSTKTRIGATPFKARTNNFPRIATAGIDCGAKHAIKIPIIRPMMISLISATSWYFRPS